MFSIPTRLADNAEYADRVVCLYRAVLRVQIQDAASQPGIKGGTTNIKYKKALRDDALAYLFDERHEADLHHICELAGWSVRFVRLKARLYGASPSTRCDNPLPEHWKQGLLFRLPH